MDISFKSHPNSDNVIAKTFTHGTTHVKSMYVRKLFNDLLARIATSLHEVSHWIWITSDKFVLE